MATGNPGPVVIPGSAETSILFESPKGKVDDIAHMPLGGSLTAEGISTIGVWTDGGAPEDQPGPRAGRCATPSSLRAYRHVGSNGWSHTAGDGLGCS